MLFRPHIDESLIGDFIGELADAQLNLETALKALETANDPIAAVHPLFRIVHSIKSNFRMMELAKLSESIHLLENLLAQLRDGARDRVPGITLLFSLVVEQAKQIAIRQLRGEGVDEQVNNLAEHLTMVLQAPRESFSGHLLEVLVHLDSTGEYGADYPTAEITAFLSSVEDYSGAQDHQDAPIAQETEEELEKELIFFCGLITRVETFFPYWEDRTNKILSIVIRMNEHQGRPVDQVQLRAATYLHDIGMIFLPPQSIYQPQRLSPSEYSLMQSHCQLGYDLLRRIPGWHLASQMVLHHHERIDGTGYPAGLKGQDICDGGKILAIADAFAAITAQGKSDGKKRPLMHAVLEINRGADTQFDPHWVEAFNAVVRGQASA